MNRKVTVMDNPGMQMGSEVALSLGILAVLIIILIPLPTTLLDMLLIFSISSSIIILLIALYTVKPLDLSIFPSILLVITLFRLSLNVASTKLILLHGNEGPFAAGKVIKSFGNVVVGGNYVVGFVIFIILVVINFIVITKGAARIAEVAARFTLDAMPGKQMSIDADLNAGLIDENEARERRALITKEADFYGAMDGASKFVRGDAIAGIFITLVNIIGGLIIGVFQKKMGLGEAAQNYTLLTIGDGLVSQIPALIVSTAAGIQVTKASSQGSIGGEFAKQIFLEPDAIIMASGIIFLLGLVPGFPHLTFIIFSVMVAFLGYLTKKMEKVNLSKEEVKKTTPETESIESLPPLDILELEIGYGLISLVDPEQSGELLERIKALRRQFALEMGIIIPKVHIIDNLKLKSGEYVIVIKGIERARGEIMIGHYLAIETGEIKEKIQGIKTKEPVFGLPALWISEKEKEKAQVSGYTVVDPSTIIATHLSEIIKSYAHELLTRQEVQNILDSVSRQYPKLVEELTPSILPLGSIQKVLKNLLKERVSIRDSLTILETLADYGINIKDPDLLTEYVRTAISASIVKPYLTDNTLRVLITDQDVEEIIKKSMEDNAFLTPEIMQKILTCIKDTINATPTLPHPIILCSPHVRMPLKKLTLQSMPQLVVLSTNEIPPNVKINIEKRVSLKHVN
ncbi:MAG TPA: flagellar biosynthesis protein FlhA [Candidatus Desulfofervidus auxilii]|uniref:Flagellar biosynthesis protein FlhA n=1 Tax=Desulfofervidus auxilii TaxID=1621989 RepID=A0A7C1VWS0_DESA2|nr:flagellar biosynthesis protein FlhA [Candidatus Desulfofervidus auxilii]